MFIRDASWFWPPHGDGPGFSPCYAPQDLRDFLL
jgi:hypothetical protein